MENLSDKKLRYLKSIDKLIKAIDDEVDWYLASSREKDLKRKEFARKMFLEKQKGTKQTAKEEYERFK